MMGGAKPHPSLISREAPIGCFFAILGIAIMQSVLLRKIYQHGQDCRAYWQIPIPFTSKPIIFIGMSQVQCLTPFT